ncbi:hypothetical protein BMD_2234 [Priestia megaterium DSM 319]|uniref:Uncharacterized protein n=2 Tax=Priestia megaterium TaxID=1404 RepID=D5DEC4_PRIM3|nr:hypothetical protein BMD_2234 [Priestia megaterium DSM 319]AEN89843.1 hypothetical protein BMWSH_2961 [Priestia megaterium WSH-002]RMA95503.1 hypothetical protein DEU44_1669 [Priestia megaterium]
MKVRNIRMNQGNFLKGLFWGTLFSIPIWISLFGWFRILSHLA